MDLAQQLVQRSRKSVDFMLHALHLGGEDNYFWLYCILEVGTSFCLILLCACVVVSKWLSLHCIVRRVILARIASSHAPVSVLTYTVLVVANVVTLLPVCSCASKAQPHRHLHMISTAYNRCKQMQARFELSHGTTHFMLPP